MALVSMFGKMVASMKDITKKTKNMAKALILIPTAKNTKATGKMECSMAKAA